MLLLTGNYKTSCLTNQFKCGDNICIDTDDVCNGIKDCNDNSDENYNLCHKRNPLKTIEMQPSTNIPSLSKISSLIEYDIGFTLSFVKLLYFFYYI